MPPSVHTSDTQQSSMVQQWGKIAIVNLMAAKSSRSHLRRSRGLSRFERIRRYIRYGRLMYVMAAIRHLSKHYISSNANVRSMDVAVCSDGCGYVCGRCTVDPNVDDPAGTDGRGRIAAVNVAWMVPAVCRSCGDVVGPSEAALDVGDRRDNGFAR
jgi:predicted Zn-ribbon and HTH transcriptional regulator